MIDELIKKNIRRLVPYKANPVQADIIIDANESPFDISDTVREKIKAVISSRTGFNRYPDSGSERLREKIAEKYGLSPENIIAGSGSDQLITVVLNTFIDPGDVVLAPSPSFDMYRISSVIAQSRVVEYFLDPGEGYAYDVNLLMRSIKKYRPKVVFICSPNNPTGNVMSNADIGKIAEAAKKSVIVIDEAYVEFADSSFTLEAPRYENVIVLRTFSKAYGIAGLRCGFSVSSTEMAKLLQMTLPPYNLSCFTQDVAGFVLDDDKENDRRIDFIKNERDRIMNSLGQIGALIVYPSSANFFLIKVQNGEDLYEMLLDRGVRIRKFSGKRLLEDCYRINVGSREENDMVIKCLFDIFNRKLF